MWWRGGRIPPARGLAPARRVRVVDMFSVVETDAALEDLRESIVYLSYRTGGKQTGANLLDAWSASLAFSSKRLMHSRSLSIPLLGLLGYRWARAGSNIVLYAVREAEGTATIERSTARGSRQWRVALQRLWRGWAHIAIFGSWAATPSWRPCFLATWLIISSSRWRPCFWARASRCSRKGAGASLQT